MSIFEQATRKRLRFETIKGEVSVEDLWQMRLSSKNGFDLDTVAKLYHSRMEETEISFIEPKVTTAQQLVKLQFDVVKHIIDVKLREQAAVAKAQETKAQKAKLAEIIARKKDADLEGKSIEELQAMEAAL